MHSFIISICVVAKVLDITGKCIAFFKFELRNKWASLNYLNPSRRDPGRRELVNPNFYFHIAVWCLKRFYQGFKRLDKTV